MKKFLFAFFCLGASWVYAIDGIYLGGRVGFLGVTGDTDTLYDNALGYGFEVGLRSGMGFDLNLGFQLSKHDGILGLTDMNLYAPTIMAEYYFVDAGEFSLSAGVGAGMYFFDYGPSSETQFGIPVNLSGDVWLEDKLRLGLETRYHFVFGGVVADPVYYVGARVGYIFEM